MGRIAKDKFTDDSVTAQGRILRQVVPSNSDDLLHVAKALLIETDGDICVEPVDGYQQDDGTPIAGGYIQTCKAGDVFDLFRVRRVYATGTTVTSMKAIV